MNLLRFISTLFKNTPPIAIQTVVPQGVDKPESTNNCNDLGVFRSCDAIGFGIDLKGGHCFVKWTDVERVFVYKVDLLTTDEVCMDITFNGKTIVVTEETKGWDTFINQLKSTLRLNNNNWESTVLQQSFAYTPMIIYERSDK